MECRIFYSWQSDLKSSTNRTFIQDTLEKVAKRIRDDNMVEVAPRVDRDTFGVAGSPDIADTIFEKIQLAQIFVCDVSIINQGSKFRKTANPNVLIELGYAMKALGQEKIIMVFNTACGNPKDLPFDLQRIRLLIYYLPQDTSDKTQARKDLETKLDQAIRLIVDQADIKPVQEIKGADLNYQIRLLRKGQSLRGVNWDSYAVDLGITTMNQIASENGALLLTVAYPMFFSSTAIDTFRSSPEATGFFNDARQENPHAHAIRVPWNSNGGGTIFPGEWFNFFRNTFPVDIPSLVLIDNPVFLIKIELLTVLDF